jgi:hypothetical protein
MKELFYFLHATPSEAKQFLKEYQSMAEDNMSKFWIEEGLDAEQAEEEWGSEVEDPEHRVYLIYGDVTPQDCERMDLEEEWMER